MQPDIIQPFLLEKNTIKGCYINADTAVKTLLNCHKDYDKGTQKQLQEAVLLALALSAGLKYEGTFMLQIRSAGPLETLVIELSDTHQLRGYAVAHKPVPQEGSLKDIFGTGQLLFSVAQAGQQPYQGVVPLTGNTLADTVLFYFNQSDQIKTDLVLKTKGPHCRCLYIQQLPALSGMNLLDQQDIWETVSVLMHSVQKEELFDEKLPAEKLLYRLFHLSDLKILPSSVPSFGCRCQRETMLTFLKKLPEEQRNSLFKEDKITAECQFCNKQYLFSKKDF